MTGPDLLESGSARPRPRTARRRLAGLAAVLALAAGGIAFAARADPDPSLPQARSPAAAPAPAVTRQPPYYLYDVAVAGGRIYALAGSCLAPCGYRLLSWDGTRWTSTPMTMSAWATAPGRLLVTGPGNRYLAVLDGTEPGAYVSADGGRTFGRRTGTDGPPVAAVPPGLALELGPGGVGVFDPADGRRHPLRTQPTPHPLAATAAAGVLYVAARTGSALTVATSRDAGRTWATATVTTARYETPTLQLVPADDGAYLVVTRTLPAGAPGVASVWHSGPRWREVIDYAGAGGGTPKFSTAVSEPNGGILLADGTGGGQIVFDTGRAVSFSLPPGRVGDPPLIPTVLRRGSDGTTAAITADSWHLLVRHDRDVGWTVVPLPA